MVPLKLKDVAKYASLQNLLLHGLLILIYFLILKTVYANFVKLGVLDFEKILPLAGTKARLGKENITRANGWMDPGCLGA